MYICTSDKKKVTLYYINLKKFYSINKIYFILFNKEKCLY